jgi:enoyl-CoA hydratase/carnithine racemase
MPGTVQSTLTNGVRTITLNRPERLNAIGGTLCADMIAAFEEAGRSNETKVIVLAGAGRSFCAGDDLKEFDQQSATPQSARAHIESIQKASRAILEVPQTVIAAVHGWAVGGGLEWMIDCDLAIAADDARFFFPEVQLGWNVTGGASALLPRIVGAQKARALVLFGEKFGAEEALAMGLLWKVVPRAQLNAEAQATAERIAAMPEGAVRDLKRLMQRTANLDAVAAMDVETEFAVRQMLDPAMRDRLAGYFKKS